MIYSASKVFQFLKGDSGPNENMLLGFAQRGECLVYIYNTVINTGGGGAIYGIYTSYIRGVIYHRSYIPSSDAFSPTPVTLSPS